MNDPFPLSWGSRTYIMGILNLTPDSFSGDGLLQNADPIEAALAQARQFVSDGAHVLDVGGESTRPGAKQISASEEIDRILPVVQKLVTEFPGIILSIDTYKSEVAEAALSAGASWINDVWGLRADPAMPQVIARHEKMVAINAGLEIDLSGQVCSDSLGYQFYSGFGGQVDFIRGAARSRGGKPIIAMPSTARDGQVSRIVPHLTEGAGVVTTRGDVHYVVTEYGIAYLHGKSIRERVLALKAALDRLGPDPAAPGVGESAAGEMRPSGRDRSGPRAGLF